MAELEEIITGMGLLERPIPEVVEVVERVLALI